MMQTVWAVIHDGRIEPSEPVELPEGARVLVTLLPEDENKFWLETSEKSLSAIWDNPEDDAYAELLSKNEVILVRYPFSDLTAIKIRPAVVVNDRHAFADYLIVPLTSRTDRLGAGEFVLADWRAAGLNLPSAVKWEVYTVHASLVLKSVGRLSPPDSQKVEQSLREWLGLF